MNTNQYLIDFYNNYDEEKLLGSKHGSVEFLTTMRYIEKYIKSGDRVLEIGAGTGRYSHALARQGYAVDAVELIEHNIEIFSQNTQSLMILIMGIGFFEQEHRKLQPKIKQGRNNKARGSAYIICLSSCLIKCNE